MSTGVGSAACSAASASATEPASSRAAGGGQRGEGHHAQRGGLGDRRGDHRVALFGGPQRRAPGQQGGQRRRIKAPAGRQFGERVQHESPFRRPADPGQLGGQRVQRLVRCVPGAHPGRVAPQVEPDCGDLRPGRLVGTVQEVVGVRGRGPGFRHPAPGVGGGDHPGRGQQLDVQRGGRLVGAQRLRQPAQLPHAQPAGLQRGRRVLPDRVQQPAEPVDGGQRLAAAGAVDRRHAVFRRPCRPAARPGSGRAARRRAAPGPPPAGVRRSPGRPGAAGRRRSAWTPPWRSWTGSRWSPAGSRWPADRAARAPAGSRSCTAAVAAATVSVPGDAQTRRVGAEHRRAPPTACGSGRSRGPAPGPPACPAPRPARRPGPSGPSSCRRSARADGALLGAEHGQRLQHLDVELVQRFHRPPHGRAGVQPAREHGQVARRRNRQVRAGAQQRDQSAVVPRPQPVQRRGHRSPP